MHLTLLVFFLSFPASLYLPSQSFYLSLSPLSARVACINCVDASLLVNARVPIVSQGWSPFSPPSPPSVVPPRPRRARTCNVIADNIRTGAPLLRAERRRRRVRGGIALARYRILRCRTLRCLSARCRKIRAVCGVAENCFTDPDDRHVSRSDSRPSRGNKRAARRPYPRNFAVRATQGPEARAKSIGAERPLVFPF